MAIKAVLTGDLIHSQTVDNTLAYIAGLETVLRTLERRYGADVETYRGDGFQLVLKQPEHVFHCALALRAALIAASPSGERWDARLAIGIGSAQSTQGYGEAFVLSGQGLDGMKKSTLAVFSNDERFLERTELVTEFVGAIIEQWTQVEAQTYGVHLITESHQAETAQRLGKSRVTVNRALQRAQARLLDRYLERTRLWIGELAHG
ncbi:hypothetical protein SAMN04487857_113148 [Pseudomonas sp. ok272]|uniref:hypothetical protein n=1 Tax=unclassified Pseudomonas TaxID=196821 RepID=UPI0008CF51F0|nr:MULTISPECIES: hypothetical protein [unclassified Pseudomonas]SEN32032.1 hypothetical protein SAMN04487857_113148 [Pseudomonas sp. ok272]SFN18863.1 hypothetical protein SAMN04487858_11422 [Pseudomonas sp. ok602]